MNYDKKIKRMVEKYGEGIVHDLNALRTDTTLTLRWLGGKYGFTREYARILFKNYFKVPYTESFHSKIEVKKESDFQNKHNPQRKVIIYKRGESNLYRAALIEALAMNICGSLGYEITIKQGISSKTIDLIINGNKCDVKAAFSPWSSGYITKYWKFGISEKQLCLADFIICYISPRDAFYIIPIEKITGRMIYIPDNDKEHLYSEYKNAWGSLK